MINIIQAEFLKLKRSKIVLLSTLIVLSVPILLILKELFMERSLQYTEWAFVINALNAIVLPIMSGFFITFLMQKEYQDGTLINTMTAPVSRVSFVLAKLIIWLLWYVITLLLVEITTIIGFIILFPESFSAAEVGMTVLLLTKTGLFSFIACTPILWVTMKQKSLFYPSILVALAFTLIQAAGTQTSMEMILVASIVPWSAVSIASLIEPSSVYFVIAITSIVLCGIVSIVSAIRLFIKQDQ